MKFKRIIALAILASSISIVEPLSILKNELSSEVVKAAEARQVEALNRGLTAVKVDGGVLVSWRLLGTENYDIGFNIYRDGKKITGPITNKTNFLDTSGNTSSTYYVVPVVNGKEQEKSETAKVWANNYLDVPIDKPADTTLNGEKVTYSANDATVADVDGDGEYEIILKWDPSNSKDNSQSGYTSNVYIDAYKLDGTKLWRIDLGKNIRAGAHYTQFIAYDFDGDGKAEVAMKTSDGTVAGDGKVIGDKSKDYINSSGYILTGSEYLTLFEGDTGKVLDNIDYTPQRGNVSSWGDNYGNRVDRFLAGVAYLDGKIPSLIVGRGYYTRSVVSAYTIKSGKLNKSWTFDTNSSGNSSYAGQGNHSLSVADIDGDGMDEIIYGSAVIDQNGKGLYSTGMGHGDALHVGDFDPTHAGLEIYQVHEEKGSNVESVQMRDAKTGKTLWSKKTGTDVGRGLIANIGPDYYPYIALSSAGSFDSKGNTITSDVTKLGVNFANYWDGDLYREILDRTYINKWNYNTKKVDRVLTGANVHSNNGTKATPSLSADILGDWREEVIWPTSDDKALRIYTTTYESDSKLYTLMHDTQYRTAIAWQNVGYNQPPHTSYYIGEDMATPTKPNVYTAGKINASGSSNSSNSNSSGNSSSSTTSNSIEGTYYIKNVNSSKYLDVVDGIDANSTNVQQLKLNKTSAQTWKITKVSGDIYKICAASSNYGKVLDVSGNKNADGTNVAIYTDKESKNQLYKFKENSDGSYTILTGASDYKSTIQIESSSKKNNANVNQWTVDNSKNQQWKLVAVK